MKRLLLCLSAVLLSSCALWHYDELLENGGIADIRLQGTSILDLQSETLKNLPAAQVKPVVAIYKDSFQDLTGQRKSNSQFALFSTCLLYTSPSPRDGLLSRMPSSA